MAAALTGTPTVVTWAAGADPTGQSITIPSDATAVYMFWSYWNATVGGGLLSVTLNSASPAQTFENTTTANLTATGVAAWYNPSTGSQTLDVAWDLSPTEGATCIVAYVKGGDTTAWTDADADHNDSTNAVTVTLTTVVDDLVLKYDQKAGATAPSTSASWSSAQTTTNNGESARLSYISAAGTTQVCDSEDEDYSSVVAISIPAGAGGGGGSSASTAWLTA